MSPQAYAMAVGHAQVRLRRRAHTLSNLNQIDWMTAEARAHDACAALVGSVAEGDVGRASLLLSAARGLARAHCKFLGLPGDQSEWLCLAALCESVCAGKWQFPPFAQLEILASLPLKSRPLPSRLAYPSGQLPGSQSPGEAGISTPSIIASLPLKSRPHHPVAREIPVESPGRRKYTRCRM
eukprot:CAMPEP_0179865246 /NCGR_PEP_ID=MMETSP0982-20121206/16701_1 /TAXON_ID=483367 /ORGANISM="non described non described, Strain CCMP 2436" /LENGTH=181 /DNA_ID=CAMNT_0021753859 /DNA_START=154 /DNA_END=699 /DNA_ORIENTATION=+